MRECSGEGRTHLILFKPIHAMQQRPLLYTTSCEPVGPQTTHVILLVVLSQCQLLKLKKCRKGRLPPGTQSQAPTS